MVRNQDMKVWKKCYHCKFFRYLPVCTRHRKSRDNHLRCYCRLVHTYSNQDLDTRWCLHGKEKSLVCFITAIKTDLWAKVSISIFHTDHLTCAGYISIPLFIMSSYSLKCRSPSKETAVGAHSLAHIPLDMKNATRKAFLNDIFVRCIWGYIFMKVGGVWGCRRVKFDAAVRKWQKGQRITD